MKNRVHGVDVRAIEALDHRGARSTEWRVRSGTSLSRSTPQYDQAEPKGHGGVRTVRCRFGIMTTAPGTRESVVHSVAGGSATIYRLYDVGYEIDLAHAGRRLAPQAPPTPRPRRVEGAALVTPESSAHRRSGNEDRRGRAIHGSGRGLGRRSSISV